MSQEEYSLHDRSPSPLENLISPNIHDFRLPTQNDNRSVTPPSQDHISDNKQYDSDTRLILMPNNLDQSSINATYEIQLRPPSSLLENNSHVQKNNIEEESMILSTISDNNQFSSDISSLPQPMETNIEDNIHKLRLRLIDSEFKQQHHSSRNESINRSPQRKLENNLQISLDVDQNLESQRIPETFGKHYRPIQRLSISNNPYDSRIFLEPLNEEQLLYTSSNMDDLIDSMARRHLAFRRFNSDFDKIRRSNGHFTPSAEPNLSRQLSFRNRQGTDNMMYTHRSSRNQTDRGDYMRKNSNAHDQMSRSRNGHDDDDLNDMGYNGSTHRNSHVRLPPILSAYDSSRYEYSQTSSANYGSQNQESTLPFISSEHLAKLPSDIYRTTRTEHWNPPRSSRKLKKQKSISKKKVAQPETDQSEIESDVSAHEYQKKNFHNDDHGFFTVPNIQQKQKRKPRRNLFQKVSTGILFFIIIKHRAIRNRRRRPIQSPNSTIHKIRLQELLVALHRVYLEPEGPIFNALMQAVTDPISLQHGLNRSSKYYPEAVHNIGNAIKNIISKIIQFMPQDGVLGTTKKSAISSFLQDGNSYPERYFWQCEREYLDFDNSKLINITKQRAILLLIGLFIFRALITTLLIKPIKYRLILGQLTENQSISLKVLSSVLFYLGRRTVRPKSQILTLPHEWKLSLYTDRDIEPIIEHSEIKSILSTCEQSLRMWCEEYIRRIDKSFGKELRI
ncbi:unnamed protein product [Adineta steineri]|uniref:Uncharacterized protein n=1 Tax=Adineta steineri TaxID=433720 RepID=A0A818KV27_9BILA|nr:unnamed protein product [Adineta steineri]